MFMILLTDEYLEIKKTKNKGRGIFAKENIPRGEVIGDYLGKIYRPEEVTVDEENIYLMYYHDRAVICPDLNEPGLHFLNNSCNPNCWLYVYKGHTLFFSRRCVDKREELTIPYLLPPINEFCSKCPHVCYCGELNCTGTMHLSTEKYRRWIKLNEEQTRKTKRKRITYGKDLRRLSKYPKKIPDAYIEEINMIFKI